MTTQVVILFVVAAIGAIAWRLYWLRMTERIRARRRGGDDDRARFEVQLAYGIDDAPERMNRLLGKLDRHCTADRDKRSKGLGSVDVVLLGVNDRGRVVCHLLVECDDSEYAAVKRLVKQAFRGYARVREPERDPLNAFTEGLRPPADEPAADAA